MGGGVARILITGDAGFIGHHLAAACLEHGHSVLGIDTLTPYYDVRLKQARRARLAGAGDYRPLTFAIEDQAQLMAAFAAFKPEIVYHLAAQAGVRHSLDAPAAYIAANIGGSFAVLEACRAHPPKHLLLASTSSAYGANTHYPFCETDRAVHPVSLYAATKGSMELMAHAYAHLFAFPVTAFRFFTVYGPWGRPDMAYFSFAEAIYAGKPLTLFNRGESTRDFTYIDDLVRAMQALAQGVPVAGQSVQAGDSISPVAPYRLVNIGMGQPVAVIEMLRALEAALGRTALCVHKPLPPGDVVKTFASPDLLFALIGPQQATPLADGIAQFVRWFTDYRAG